MHLSEGTFSHVTILFILCIAKTRLLKYIEDFTTKKGKFSDKKKKMIFFIFPLKTWDCGYSLEPPRRGGSNEYPQSMFFSKIRTMMYTAVNPSFTVWKWVLRGSKLYWRFFVMVMQARVSEDYFAGKDQWKVGVSSIFARALRIQPYKDTFWDHICATRKPIQ